MAANKFASMLHKNCHRIIVILTYAFLEWVLILLLLLNSFFSHLIAKFAKFFGLEPSCTWCSRLDRVFNSEEKAKNPHSHHVCEAHGSEISKLSYCSTHNKLAHSKNLCIHCSSSDETINAISSTAAFFTRMSEDFSGGEEIRCSCCDQLITAKACPQPLFFKPTTWDVLFEYMQKEKAEFEPDLVKKESDSQFQEKGEEEDDQRASEKDDGKKAEVVEVEEWNSSERADDPFDEDEESVYIADMILQNAEFMDSDRFICIELNIDAEMAVSASSEEGIYSVLENEENEVQNCAEVEETMKIGHELSNREGEAGAEHEKAMSALYAELEEERKAAAEAAKETMAMITKLQEEKAAIQMEALQYQRMMEEQAEYDQEALQLLNDLMMKRDKEKREVEKELQMYRDRENSTISRKRSLSSSNNNSPPSIDLDSLDDDDDEMEGMGLEDLMVPDISLEEFEEERVSILEELKALEAKLLHLHDDDGDGDSMAKKLLPLFDEEESGLAGKGCDEEEVGNAEAAAMAMKGKMLMQEELGHVYERLRALEADKDFLKHCIRSMVKGDDGMALVHEILQNLRDLKSVELSARKLFDTPMSDASMWGHHQENNTEMRFSSA